MNEFEIKKLLEFLIFNQAHLNKRLDKIEGELTNSIKSRSVVSSLQELKREFDKSKNEISEIVNTI